MDEVLLTSGEFAVVLGKSRRTVLGWDRKGILHPSIRPGKDRRYTFADLVAGAMTIAWTAQGVDTVAIKRMIHHIQHGGLEHLEERPYLVLCGNRVWACEEGAEFRMGQAAQAFVADLRPAVESTRQRLEAWQAKRQRQGEEVTAN